MPWHATRGPVRELVDALDAVAAACEKIALDVVLLAQTEVGEVRVAEGGRSSTMPHKRNPTGAVLARACAIRVHALARTFDAAHEHERAAGAWHAEWEALSDLLALTGGRRVPRSRDAGGARGRRERMRGEPARRDDVRRRGGHRARGVPRLGLGVRRPRARPAPRDR